MSVNVLLTGATGAIGPHLAAELLASPRVDRLHVLVRPNCAPAPQRFDNWAIKVWELLPRDLHHDRSRLQLVVGDLANETVGPAWRDLAREVSVILHAAADTRFHAPAQEQWNINVTGTQRLLDWARTCPRLGRFLQVSTVCVAGSAMGRIPEASFRPPRFLNRYEETKWEAERLALAAPLPVQVARVSVVMGSHESGIVHNPGALHQVLRWFGRGAMPLVPGTQETTVDMICAETAAKCLAKAATMSDAPPSIFHIAAGDAAIPLPQLMQATWEHFAPSRRREQPFPRIVDLQTYRAARSTLDKPARHAAAGRTAAGRTAASLTTAGRTAAGVADWIDSFLPGLLQPRTFNTTRAQDMWGGPLPLEDWRGTLKRVIGFLCRRQGCGAGVPPASAASLVV